MDSEPLNSEEQVKKNPSNSTGWLWGVVAVLCCGVIVALGFFFYEQDARRQLASANAQVSTDMDQMHDQVQALTAKMNALMTTPPAPVVVPGAAPAVASGSSSSEARPGRRSAKKKVRDDPRWKKVESEIADNKQQLDSTSQDLQAARSEFQNGINSTRDDLNGSIAKTHDELVALEKRGERNYFEFKLTKAKGFERIGPLGLSLRKTNTKHEFYDMAVMVEDSRLDKKHVSLFEPVSFFPADSHQPVQLVVNQINKNGVEGYVSAPKESEARGTASSSAGASNAPAPGAAPEGGASESNSESTAPGSFHQAPNSNPGSGTANSTPQSPSSNSPAQTGTGLEHRPITQL